MPIPQDKRIEQGRALQTMKASKGWGIVLEEFTQRRESAIKSLLECEPEEIECHRQRAKAIDDLLHWVDKEIKLALSAQERLSGKGEATK